MKKSTIYLILLALLSASILTGCSQSNPDEFKEYYVSYMEAFKRGVAESVEYAYLDEATKQSYIESNEKVLDYKIKDIEKVNNNLYAFTVSVSAESSGQDNYMTAYNFVGKIDGRLYVILNAQQIPDKLRKGLDESKYSYKDPLA